MRLGFRRSPVVLTLIVLSLLAAFGGITAIFQIGFLADLFGVHAPGPVLSFLPIIATGILFGLAMDYQLFLVSGMRESYAHGAPARVAVQHGLHAGRAVVTAAAIIMISVFAGFIFSHDATIKPIGFGLAAGHQPDGDNLALPLGIRVELDTERGRLAALEPAVV